jgi:hypothetical protein
MSKAKTFTSYNERLKDSQITTILHSVSSKKKHKNIKKSGNILKKEMKIEKGLVILFESQILLIPKAQRTKFLFPPLYFFYTLNLPFLPLNKYFGTRFFEIFCLAKTFGMCFPIFFLPNLN